MLSKTPFTTRHGRDRAAGAAPLGEQRRLAEILDRRVARRAYASLSRRERAVMALVVSGRLNKQIADELRIGEVTVKGASGAK